jgi:hypothetical protein
MEPNTRTLEIAKTIYDQIKWSASLPVRMSWGISKKIGHER